MDWLDQSVHSRGVSLHCSCRRLRRSLKRPTANEDFTSRFTVSSQYSVFSISTPPPLCDPSRTENKLTKCSPLNGTLQSVVRVSPLVGGTAVYSVANRRTMNRHTTNLINAPIRRKGSHACIIRLLLPGRGFSAPAVVAESERTMRVQLQSGLSLSYGCGQTHTQAHKLPGYSK